METAKVLVTLKQAHMIILGIGMLVMVNLGKSEPPDYVLDIIQQTKDTFGEFETLDLARQDEAAEYNLTWQQVSAILTALGNVAVYGGEGVIEGIPYPIEDVDATGYYFSQVAYHNFRAEYDAAIRVMQARLAAEEG